MSNEGSENGDDAGRVYDDDDMSIDGMREHEGDSAAHSLGEGVSEEAKESKEKIIIEVVGAVILLVGIIAGIVVIMNKTQNFCIDSGNKVNSPLCKALDAASGALSTILAPVGLFAAAAVFLGSKAVEAWGKRKGGGGGGKDGGPVKDGGGKDEGPVKDGGGDADSDAGGDKLSKFTPDHPDPDENIFDMNK